MKTSNYILPAIIFALLLSSCGSLSISQKRYSRGLNIDLFSSKDEKQEVKAKKTVKKSVPAIAQQKEKETEVHLMDEPIYLPVESSLNQDFSQNNENLTEQSGRKGLNTRKSSVKKGQSESGFRQKDAVGKLEKQMLKTEDRVKSNSPNETNEVSTLILVILCIIPPLGILAVYLHQGEINDKFWISLILHFLFLLPGMIYSILVVLDVI